MEGFFLTLVFIGALVGLSRLLSGQQKEKPFPPSETDVAPAEPLSRPAPRRQPDAFEPASAKPAPPASYLEGPAYVVDGDTITVQKTQIRLFGIDAPELDHPYGQKAKWAMVKLCKGQRIRAEITDVDAHGRTVARCFLPDGRDLSAELVKVGLAIDWPKYSKGAYLGLEVPGIRKKLWLADARQKGRMHVWEQFEARKKARAAERAD